MPEKVVIAGSERAELPGATLLGPVGDDERLSASIAVRQRPDGPGRAAELARAARTPEPYLSNEEFTAIYRADDADIQAVADFARGRGFTVESASAPRRTVRISGTARQFQDVFGTRLQRYQYEGSMFRGRTGPLYCPAEVAPLIDGVFGLDERPIGRRDARPPRNLST
jgi:kumamolisin